MTRAECPIIFRPGGSSIRHGTSWAGAYFGPRHFRDYPDIDDRKLAILEPPNARYAARPSRPEPLAAISRAR